MSLGNTYNNNQGRQSNPIVDGTTYSDYRMNNPDSTIDASCLAPRFWKQNLCLSIYPRKKTGNDEIVYDMDNGVTIYLSHSKALILAEELKLFLKDPITYNCNGVNCGSAVATISNGAEYGKNTPVLTIRKMDENNNVVASFAYEFKTNYFSIRNYDGATNFDTIYDGYENIEILQLITLLEEYCKAATKAVAHTIHSSNYGLVRVNNTIESIAQNLGVEVRGASNGQRTRYNSNSFFGGNGNNSGNNSAYPPRSNVSYGMATIEDIE